MDSLSAKPYEAENQTMHIKESIDDFVDESLHSACKKEIEVHVGIGSRVIVASDLLIGRFEPGTRGELTKFKEYLATLDGPGVIIFAGNLFDLSNQTLQVKVCDLIDQEKEFFGQLRDLTTSHGFEIYILPGSRDRSLAWDLSQQKDLETIGQASLGIKVSLIVETTNGPKTIDIFSGREFEARSNQVDPYSKVDTPWSTHLIGEIIPHLTKRAKWLEGIDLVDNQGAISRFFASRIFYRKAMRYLPWLIAPILGAFFIKLPVILALPTIGHFKHRIRALAPFIQIAGAATLLDAVLVLTIATWLARRTYAGMIENPLIATNSGEALPNLAARIAAMEALDDSHIGTIIGNSLNPEMTDMTSGFFCATGGISKCYRESPARFGLPSVFQPIAQCTWVEIQPGAKVRVRLYSQTEELPLESRSERLVRLGKHDPTSGLRILASYPGGEGYIPSDATSTKFSRPRRLVALGVLLVGLIDLISTLVPPLRSRLSLITEFIPLAVPVAANAIAAIESVGLMALASGLRRGQRVAYLLTVAIASASVITNLIKGGDIEESILTAILVGSLVASRKAFTAPTNRIPMLKGIIRIPIGWLLIFIAGSLALRLDLLLFSRSTSIGILNGLLAVLERMVGSQSIPIPHSINLFLAPALSYSALTLLALLLLRASRPVVEAKVARLTLPGRPALTPTEIVNRYSKTTLDYFALRDDKSHFIAYNTLIAYAVIGTVAVVSPDPIGPAATATQAWNAFRNHANSNGWTICVLGSGEPWQTTYASSGLHSIYIGDEAVVNVSDFHLDGNKNKSLRQAVNRMRNYNYRVEFVDPATVSGPLRDELTRVLAQSRKGGVERGFSMTLGRFLDPRDIGLLLSIAYGPNNEVVGFCQWVPAPGINGYSLDLMRRDLADHPNGLTDLMVVATIEYLRANAMEALSLNFATMRAVIAGETEDGVSSRIERWFLKRLSDTMQIESLWRFNSKFHPIWLPRYLVFESPDSLPQIAIAIARAESLWELPVIGKFLVPKQ
ncbi:MULTISPECIES: phosphatidylglycerol lysyltransferase domain-containing protein [Acidithrix]|uniref:Lysylphosphatidylglycerol biosynthesis bifunctional protein LysX n=1 Tax=Acidithrix ferrooxidans TaxID=1280514 RepID=A0A0D8HKS7_9ACTN|nr:MULTISPECIES: phosphatidylglycerol lysyltransferase domain-containing protein [Acidithrix]KJF18610.1 lysylphosphatidylglycerol biosynthesis bifunctional protein LysX [Acidithrix ferrooxidans]CAG4932943.1 unnamed protein product [Acidithrix sp. C25]